MKVYIITDREDKFLKAAKSKKEIYNWIRSKQYLKRSYMSFTRWLNTETFTEVFEMKVKQIEL